MALACSAARRLGESAPRWPAGSPAQWQKLRMWICVGPRDPPTKTIRGWLWVVVRKPRLFLPKLGRRGIKLRRKQGPTAGGVALVILPVSLLEFQARQPLHGRLRKSPMPHCVASYPRPEGRINKFNRKLALHRDRIGKRPSAPEKWPTIMERAENAHRVASFTGWGALHDGLIRTDLRRVGIE